GIGAVEALEDAVGAQRASVAFANDVLGVDDARHGECGDKCGDEGCGAAAAVHSDGSAEDEVTTCRRCPMRQSGANNSGATPNSCPPRAAPRSPARRRTDPSLPP